MLFENFAREWLNLAECNGLKPLSALQPEREAAKSAEDIENPEFHAAVLTGTSRSGREFDSRIPHKSA
jgi:hypothetical protein